MNAFQTASAIYDLRKVSMSQSLDGAELLKSIGARMETRAFRKLSNIPSAFQQKAGGYTYDVRELNFHAHSFCQIILVEKGSCIYAINNRWLELHQGDVLFINTEVAHSWFSEKDSQVIYLIFKPEELKFEHFDHSSGAKFSLFFSCAYPYDLISPGCEEYPAVTEAIRQIMAEDERKAAFFENIIYSSLIRLTCLLMRRNLSPEGLLREENIPGGIRAALEYMKENLCNDIGIEEVAGHIYHSPAYFSHVFRKTMGVSFTRYLTIQRLSLAAESLRQGTEDVSTIAMKCGFRSLSSFYKYFTEYYGNSPIAYRKLLNADPEA